MYPKKTNKFLISRARLKGSRFGISGRSRLSCQINVRPYLRNLLTWCQHPLFPLPVSLSLFRFSHKQQQLEFLSGNSGKTLFAYETWLEGRGTERGLFYLYFQYLWRFTTLAVIQWDKWNICFMPPSRAILQGLEHLCLNADKSLKICRLSRHTHSHTHTHTPLCSLTHTCLAYLWAQ